MQTRRALPLITIALLLSSPSIASASLFGWLFGSGSKTPTSQVKGVIDGVRHYAGSYTIDGWACQTRDNRSLDVHVYVGGPAGNGTFLKAAKASLGSEPAVATACESSGRQHRFRIALNSADLYHHAGKTIHVHGISVQNTGNLQIHGSGAYRMPPMVQEDALLTEPPRNYYLADSPWPMTHRNSYAQGSSPEPGPTSNADLPNTGLLNPADFEFTDLGNITLAMSPRYNDGLRVYWGSAVGTVYKVAANGPGIKTIATITKPGGPTTVQRAFNATSGAYAMVGHDNTFYAVDAKIVAAYTDAQPGNRLSDIQELRRFHLDQAASLPAVQCVPESERVVGMNMTYDGYIALATNYGAVGVLSRDFKQLQMIRLSDAWKVDQCASYGSPSANAQIVSNSIATDEEGGIYVVTTDRMFRVQWSGSLFVAWNTQYKNDFAPGATLPLGRLGPGSGSTPSLMGHGGMDKFVVISDGQNTAHIVMFRRDNGAIAAQVPVTYNNHNTNCGTACPPTVSEQSLLVRGYGVVVVSNDYPQELDLSSRLVTGFEFIDNLIANSNNFAVIAISGRRLVQPWGVQKFEWHPATQSLSPAWATRQVSCPNSIPTMSAASNMFYCVGARDGSWTIEGIDWRGGQSAFSKFVGKGLRYNSFYAATQVGEDGAIVYGTSLGVVELDKK
ncbi:MAG: hypothetical protein ACK4SX_11700 [Alcanivoracaceae bacterium]